MPITTPVPVLLILYITDHHRPSSSPPYTLQSSSEPVTVLPLIYSPLQIQCKSSVFSTVHYKSSTSPPYNIMSSYAPVPVLRLLCSPAQTLHILYTLQFTTHPVLVLRILCSQAQIQYQYQSSIYSTVHDKQIPVPRITYSPLQIKNQSSIYSTVHRSLRTSPLYTLLSTTEPFSVLCIL